MNRALLILVVLLMSAANAGAEEKPKAAQPKEAGLRPASFGMKVKLEFAKALLDGLATEDFAKIEEGARAMRGLNEIEDFVRGRSPKYTSELNVFRIATDTLVHSAAEKNLDGASLAFTQMTISCVNCHKVLRSIGK